MSAVLPMLALVSQVATLLIGTFVAYQSYRGYRRNDSTAMLALALGLVLLIPVAYLAHFALDGLSVLGATQAELVSQAISVAGLLVIFYGLVRD